jgi:hypothetical protein
MKRLGVKFMITTLLVVFFALLLTERLTKSNQRLMEGVSADVAIPLSEDLRQAIQESLHGGARPAVLYAATTPSTQRVLPRDPFAFRPTLDPRQHAPEPVGTPSAEQEVKPPTETILRLKATMVDRFGTMAFINDEIVTTGQVILGYRVVRINDGHVELTGHGETVHLRLHDGGKP